MAKEDLTRSFFDAEDDDVPIGTFALAFLPEKLFREVIAQHNEKVKKFVVAIPKRLADLPSDLGKLYIPTYEEFQGRLADKDLRSGVPAEHRKIRDFQFYRSWVLDQAPISTVLRDTFFRPRFPAYASAKQRRRHTLLVGRSGSGKSEVLKLLALATKVRAGKLRRDVGLVLIDPHGDLAEQLARQECFARDFKEHPSDPNLVYLDLFLGANTGKFPTLNPLDLSSHSYTHLQREKLAEQLQAVFRSLIERDNYSLSVNMTALLLPCLNVLLNRPGSTFYDLLTFLDDDSNAELVELGCRSPNPGHRFFFQSSFQDKRFDVTKGALSTKVTALLNSRAFDNFMAQPRSTLDLEAALNAGKTVILNCAIGRSGSDTAEALGRFLVGMILGIAFNRAENPQRKRVPIFLCIDEAHRFISDSLQTILVEARKYALHITLGLQVIGQGMGPELTRVVLGNTAVQMIGSAGNDSHAVMAREMGVRTDFFGDMAVGEFAVKSGASPPIRVRMSPEHLGRSTQMSQDAWRRLREFQLQRYYRSATATGDSSSEGPQETEASQSEALREDIVAAAPVPSAATSSVTNLDTTNPFADLPTSTNHGDDNARDGTPDQNS